MKKLLMYTLLVATIATGCETLPDAEIKLSPVYPISGEWWVKYEFDDGSGVIDDYYGVGYTRLLTFNTAANTPDSVWMTDEGNFWDFKVKVPINVKARTFAVTDGEDLSYGDDTTISNGLVTERSDGDEFHMEIQWASDPTTTYVVSGRRVKGFLDGSGNTSYEADYPGE